MPPSETAPLRVGLLQRILPTYRVPLFELIGSYPDIHLSVATGTPGDQEGTRTADGLRDNQHFPLLNRQLPANGSVACWQRGVHDWLESFDPECLIVPTNPRLLSSWSAVRWARRRSRPVLGFGLGLLPRAHLSDVLRRQILIRFISPMSGILAYSEKGAQDYIDIGIPADRVFVAYNAIDTRESAAFREQLSKTSDWKGDFRKSLQLPVGPPLFVSVGRITEEKRLDLLLEALTPLHDRCALLVVGDGPGRAEVEAQARDSGIRVAFTGYLQGEELARCFLAADAFVLPGPGGLALQQAASYGKPMIVSIGDGTERDLVDEGVNGFFFTAGDAASLRQALARFIAVPNGAEMGENSLRRVEEKINLDNLAQTFRRVAHEAMTWQPGQR